jgi:hypothetical protein
MLVQLQLQQLDRTLPVVTAITNNLKYEGL